MESNHHCFALESKGELRVGAHKWYRKGHLTIINKHTLRFVYTFILSRFIVTVTLNNIFRYLIASSADAGWRMVPNIILRRIIYPGIYFQILFQHIDTC